MRPSPPLTAIPTDDADPSSPSLQEYSNVNRTYNDVAQVLSQYPSLSPRTDVHSTQLPSAIDSSVTRR